MDKFTYLQFPLCLLQELSANPAQTIELMISYGVKHYAKSIKPNIQDVCRQLIYDYARDRESLPRDLVNFVTDLDEDENSEVSICDEGLFDATGSYAPKFLDTLCDEIKSYPDQLQAAIEHCQLHQAEHALGLNKIDRSDRIKKVESIIKQHEAMHGKQPMPSINKETLFSFRDCPQNLDLFMAFVAIKSLIGWRKYIATYRTVIVMRMIGAKNKKALEYALKNKDLKAIYDKYIKRYQFDRLIERLLKAKFITAKIGYERKIYISTVYDFETLGEEIMKDKSATDFKQQEQAAREKLKQYFKNRKNEK